MAKQLGYGFYSGKLGQTVGRRKAKGQKTATVGAYQPNVTNPKTIAQRLQRVKLLPANNFYRALVELLDHSWQGVPYIGPSHNEFMKYALKMEEGFPYLVQGDTRPVPGSYLISKGALAPLTFANTDINMETVTNYFGDLYTNAPTITLSALVSSSVVLDSDAKVKDLSAIFLQCYPFLREGDQLTFIFALADSDELVDDTQVYYRFGRLVLDNSSETSLDDWETTEKLSIDNAHEKIILSGAENQLPLGAAIIVSRPPLRQGGAWQRSTTYFTVTNDVLTSFMTPSAQQAALDSLDLKISEQTSDWYLNQGSTSSTSQGGGSLAERSLASAQISIGGQTKNRLVMIQGNKTYLVAGPVTDGNRYLYNYSASTNTAVYSADTLETVANIEASAMEIRLITTVKSYFPQLNVEEGGTDDQP